MPESLLRRVAKGDQTAVDQVLDRYGGLVWSIARRFSANAADAEDAAQEVFIDVWRSASRFDESLSSEESFVALIARRRLVDRFRRVERKPVTTSLPAELPAAGDASQIERVALGDEAARVSQALASLRPEQQQVLKLSIYDGLSHEEIARATGFPLGTVKTHARRGLSRIREMVGQPRPGAAREGTV